MSEGNEQHWAETIEHASVTTENRADFVSANSKYATVEDAAFGGFNAQKMAGKPFKFPEAMENLPDDQSRTDFKAGANKLLGREFAASVDDLELDLKSGSAEGTQTDETLAAAFKDYIVANNISKSDAQKMLTFHNESMGKAVVANASAKEAAELETMKSCNEALVSHPDFGTQDKVDEQSELMRRAIKNNCGLTATEYEEFGEELSKSILTQNPVMARVMLKVLAPMAAESNHENNNSQHNNNAAKANSIVDSPSGKVLWPNG